MKTAISILTALALLAAPPAVWAHAALQRSEPAMGSEVAKAPQKVEIWFTEALEPALSKLEVKTAAGKSVVKGDSKVDPADKRHFEIAVENLPSGTYRVEWSVVSVDGHKTTGSFVFIVK